ncbi:MAG: tetratricopeptide repeat protein [Muribaculaceae bacterium]|nr:tetratricopeptide repeat protein [Muribaculaceae bacterium]
MKKENTTVEQVEKTEDILAKAKANKKSIILGLIIALVIIIAGGIWSVIRQSGSNKADELISKADIEQTDSIATALYAEAANAGYKSGNRAKAEMGIRLYRDGKYEEALKYLEDASLDDKIAAAGVYTLRGDCYVNLDNFDKALNCYDKAISKADKNPELVPLILVKKANIFRAQGKYADEASAYKTIIDSYPEYVSSMRTDIKKYYERAIASQNK